VITGGQVSAFDAATGALRWTVELPAAPALDALALDRAGNALIGLQDGSVVCVGKP
jgi:outer membrane protein assembly factor BamB